MEWIQWLVQEESHFERATGLTASFGEMLLLMAIHFHSNQINAIGDLVCQTLGMKIAIRINRYYFYLFLKINIFIILLKIPFAS